MQIGTEARHLGCSGRQTRFTLRRNVLSRHAQTTAQATFLTGGISMIRTSLFALAALGLTLAGGAEAQAQHRHGGAAPAHPATAHYQGGAYHGGAYHGNAYHSY